MLNNTSKLNQYILYNLNNANVKLLNEHYYFQVPYRTLHPEASEWHWKTRKGTEKSADFSTTTKTRFSSAFNTC